MPRLSKEVTYGKDDIRRLIEQTAPGLMAELRQSPGSVGTANSAHPPASRATGLDEALVTGYYDHCVANWGKGSKSIRFANRAAAGSMEAWLKPILERDAFCLADQRQYLRGRLAFANRRDLRHYVDRNVAPGLGGFVTPAASHVQHGYVRGRPLFVTDTRGRRRQVEKELVDWVVGDPPVTDRGRVVHLLHKLSRDDHVNPLGGDMSILTMCWQNLAPPNLVGMGFRPASINKERAYPSSVVGTHLMNQLFYTVGLSNLPARGDEPWVDWALLFLIAIMAAQPFPDCNKRVARFAYALILHSAGLDAPSMPDKALAGELAKQGMLART